MSNSSIWLIDRTLPGATTPGQSESENDGNERVLCIPQSSSITEAAPSDCLVLYPGILHLCRDAVGVFYNPSRLGQQNNALRTNYVIAKE